MRLIEQAGSSAAMRDGQVEDLRDNWPDRSGTAQARYRWSVDQDRLDWTAGSAAALGLQDAQLPSTSSGLSRIGGRGAPRDRDAFIALARIGAMSREVTKTFEYPISAPDGAPRWVEERILFRPGPAGEASGARCEGFLRDVTERSRAEAQTRDPLTGAYSREELRRRLADRLADPAERASGISFAVVCLDHLSTINNAFGYDIADDVIATVSAQLTGELEAGEQFGRISGGKFGVIMQGGDPDEIRERVMALRGVIRGRLFETLAGPVSTTASAGYVLDCDAFGTAQDVMSAALDALMEAKRIGADAQMPHDDAISRSEERSRSIALANELSSALAEDRIVIAYQPIVDARDTDRLAFHECLARIRRPDGELVAAGMFMPVAEKLGLVRLLDRRVLTLALEALKAHPSLRLSVNLSPATTHDDQWLEIFESACAERRDLAERLVFEVTETTAIADAPKAASFINHIRSYGAAVAIDDFGAGYTSFRHLKDLRLDMVKIDGAFIRDIRENPDNQLFVKTLLSISKHFDMLCVAEFVDSRETAEFLRDLGVDCLQGYHFGAPDVTPPAKAPKKRQAAKSKRAAALVAKRKKRAAATRYQPPRNTRRRRRS